MYQDYIQTAILSIQLSVMTFSRYASTGSTAYDYTIKHEHYDTPRHHEDTCPLVQFAHLVDEFVVQITPESEWFLVSTNLVGNLMLLIIITMIIVIYSSIIISTISTWVQRFNWVGFSQRVLIIIENEFTVARSLILIISMLVTIILFGTIIPIITFKTPGLTFLILSLIGLFLTMILLWPLSLLYNWGTYFTIYIKGESTMSNLLGQVVMDYFYVVSFFLRINLQFLRLVVLSGVFIMYNEFYFEFIYPIYNFNITSVQSWEDYTLVGIKLTLSSFGRFIYELGHMWVVVLMQANAFTMILFLILQSLHTVYLISKLQIFFKHKRFN